MGKPIQKTKNLRNKKDENIKRKKQ